MNIYSSLTIALVICIELLATKFDSIQLISLLTSGLLPKLRHPMAIAYISPFLYRFSAYSDLLELTMLALNLKATEN
jgi:hypothetical protein